MSTGNFTKLPNELFEYGKHLTLGAKFVYVTLCNFKNNKTGRTFPSYEKKMERSGLGRNKVAAALKELEYFCWITRKKKFRGSNNYEVTQPVLDHCHVIAPSKEEALIYKRSITKSAGFAGFEPVTNTHEEEATDDEFDDDEIPF